MPSAFLAKLLHVRLAILKAQYEEGTFQLSALCVYLVAVTAVGQSTLPGMFSQVVHGGGQYVSQLSEDDTSAGNTVRSFLICKQ